MSDIDDFSKLLDRNYELQSRVLSYDKMLSMNFSNSFMLILSQEINFESSVEHTVSLVSGDSYSSLNELPAEIRLTENKLMTQFKNSLEEVFHITFYLSDLTAFKKILSLKYLVMMFWSVDGKYDLEELQTSNPSLPLLLIHYSLGTGDLEEDLYVSIAKV